MTSSLGRFLTIVRAFSVYYWKAHVVNNGKANGLTRERAILFRETFEDLGSVFFKFGQLLALRPDFLPTEYCRELFYLLEEAPLVPKEEVISIIKAELGDVPDKIYKEFDYEPLAIASFGQVHKAKLRNGEDVVVKVQRPDLDQLVKLDISILKFIARLIDLFPLGLNKVLPIVEEFEFWTREELDYIQEASYTTKFFKKIDELVIPKVYSKFSTPKVLTTTYLEGITLSKVLIAKRNGDKGVLENLKNKGFSPQKISLMLFRIFAKMIYIDGFFHADPHPANVMWLDNGKLALIDFGIVGTLSEAQRRLCLRYTRSALCGDGDTAYDALSKLCDISKTKNLDQLKREHDLLIKDSLANFEGNGELGAKRQVLGQKLYATVRLLQKHNVRFPVDTMRYFRTLSTLESLVVEINPTIKLSELARKLRNITMARLIVDLPDLFDKSKFEKSFYKLVNALEAELI
ncbi:AarF/ABC1/UbiB kinase family protein [Candidatus Microgenomates bacterium]|nr:AarF/ABC1/UbiB kinase family protein [Candidatus Microgenomates bacterium]